MMNHLGCFWAVKSKNETLCLMTMRQAVEEVVDSRYPCDHVRPTLLNIRSWSSWLDEVAICDLLQCTTKYEISHRKDPSSGWLFFVIWSRMYVLALKKAKDKPARSMLIGKTVDVTKIACFKIKGWRRRRRRQTLVSATFLDDDGIIGWKLLLLLHNPNTNIKYAVVGNCVIPAMNISHAGVYNSCTPVHTQVR